MKKKILKITGIALLLIVGTLIAAPFFLKEKIASIIKEKVNQNINGTLDFAEADLSLFSNFPQAKVSLKDISIVNNAPFVGDTLFSASHINLEMSIKELFKGQEETITIKSLKVDGAHVNIKVDANENANYDIGKDNGTDTNEETSGFNLGLESYEITNTNITYNDIVGGLLFMVTDMNHYGTGDLSLEKSELDTQTNALVTFVMDSTKYLNNNKIKLDALIGIDLKENKYSFLKNEAIINQLALVFSGFVKINEESQDVDVSFKTPSSDFKNFLAVIPEVYSKNISTVKTTGNFSLEGEFKGVVDEEHIPAFNIKINSDNASFKYPDLPKAVRNVFINVELVNKTGITENTYVDINRLSFMIDEDTFTMTSKIRDLMGNPKVNAHIDGKMNLANISKAYPVPEGMDLKGLLDANITTAFDMASIENEQYANTNTSGRMAMTNFEYNSEELANPVQLNTVTMNFNPRTVTLKELKGVTGKTDFNATGTINNLLGFMFNDEKVEGNFNLQSDRFALSDFMVEEETNQEGVETSEEKIKIPSFLDCTINVAANTVLYDNLILKDVKGNLRIKDEKATLTNMTSSMFDGNLGFSGEVSTKEEIPTFSMKLDMEKFKIEETFNAIELFQTIAPIAKILKGKINSTIALSGNLTEDLFPDTNSLSGDIVAEVLATNVKVEEAPLLSSLSNNLSFLDLKDLDLKGLKTFLSFKDGVVTVKPFKVDYKDMVVNVTGSHTFDKKLTYKAALDVPAKYLGAEITQLITKIDDTALEGLTIPVTANIGGDYDSPTVKTDLTSGVKILTTKLIEIQKQKLITKGKEEVKGLLGGILSGNSSEKDTTKSSDDTTKEAIKGVLGGILGNKTDAKEKDNTETAIDTPATTANEEKDVVKEAATSILGGLLGRKKKKDTVD